MSSAEKQCEFSGRRVYFEVVASIPPISVNNADGFWYEFQEATWSFASDCAAPAGP